MVDQRAPAFYLDDLEIVNGGIHIRTFQSDVDQLAERLCRRDRKTRHVASIRHVYLLFADGDLDSRIALMGEVIGLIAATLATVALIRRPPWPDLRVDYSRHA